MLPFSRLLFRLDLRFSTFNFLDTDTVSAQLPTLNP
jgi:hypothetical protein